MVMSDKPEVLTDAEIARLGKVMHLDCVQRLIATIEARDKMLEARRQIQVANEQRIDELEAELKQAATAIMELGNRNVGLEAEVEDLYTGLKT
jgi:hypothetical protein